MGKGAAGGEKCNMNSAHHALAFGMRADLLKRRGGAQGVAPPRYYLRGGYMRKAVVLFVLIGAAHSGYGQLLCVGTTCV